MKCLFLCVRKPLDSAFDSLVKRVFNIENIHSEKAKYVLLRTKNSLRDYRNKFIDNVVKLVDEYKSLGYFSYFLLFLPI